MKLTQEQLRLRQISDLCAKTIEYKAEDLEIDSEGKFVCPECNKTYSRIKTLNKHVVIHSLEKSPQCPQCGEGI